MARLPLLFVLLLTGCIADTAGDDDGDPGDEELTAETEEALSRGCSISRATILASASGARSAAIERGFQWLDAKVPYSQARTHAGYRTDCSGFVSMCWQTGRSYTTADFASGGGASFPLSSYAQLLPGDALVRRANGKGHVVLFLGWNDAARSSACVLEQNGTALDMEFGARPASSLRAAGYRAIRADRFR
jgi:hypothetical protein